MMFAISLNPIDWVTSAAGAVAGAATNAVFDGAAKWVEDGLADIAGKVAGFFTDLGESNLGDETILQLGGLFKWIALATVTVTIIAGAGGSLLGSHKLGDVVQEIPVTLLMLSGWYGALALWTELTNELTRLLLTDSMVAAFENGLALDPGMASFFRLLVALTLIIFLLIFMVEMLLLSHMLALAAVLGPLSIALRPWPSLRAVAGRMLRNLILLSITPALAAASLAIALRTLNEQGQLSFFGSLGAITGLAISVLMPAMVNRFLPLDAQGGLGARGLIAAGVGAAGVVAAGVAAGVATGGAGAVAAAPGAVSAASSLGSGDE
jgi:hypothetical protein